MKRLVLSLLFICALVLCLAACTGAPNIILSSTSSSTASSTSDTSSTEQSPYSQGLTFKLSGDLSYYTLSSAKNCTDTDVVIPPTYKGKPVKEIGKEAFFPLRSTLKSISIPESVTKIGKLAFQNCGYLETVSLGENSQLQIIDESAFLGCSSLKSFVVPCGVTSIGADAFYNCYNLTLTFEEGTQIASIGGRAFANCTSFKSFTVPKAITSIEISTFSGCSRLASITFEEGSVLQSIGEHAFSGCSALTSFTIPASVTTLGPGLFRYCSALTNIVVEEGNTSFKTFENSLYSIDGSTILFYIPNDDETTFVFPPEVTAIGPYAFFKREALESMHIPAVITSIGDHAFENCNNLQSVTLEEGSLLQSIGCYGFAGCSIESFPLLEATQLAVLGDYAFSYCRALKSVTFPPSVTSVGFRTFQQCIVLESATFAETNSLESISREAFYYCEKLKTVSLGKSSQIETIGILFPYCTSLESISFPDSVTSIGDRAFEYFDSLTCVTFAENSRLETIGERAFYECKRLTSIELPASLIYIGVSAFKYCWDLENIVFQEGSQLKTIGAQAFAYSSAFSKFHIPASVTTISEKAFYECGGLKHIIIPEGVSRIGTQAFFGCRELRSVTFSKNITYFESGTFTLCEKIEAVYFGGTEAQYASIGENGGLKPSFKKATVYYYSETAPTEEGDFWHWEEGIVAPWTPFVPASASRGLVYTLNADGKSYTVSGMGTCTDTDVFIPRTHEGLYVTAIGNQAFQDCTSLISITFPNTLKNIGSNVFSGCDNLSSVTFKAVAQWQTSHRHIVSEAVIADTSKVAEYLRSTYVSYAWECKS